MVCTYCDSRTKTAVVNSRVSANGQTTWRRRQCKHCSSLFTTREHIELESALRIQSSKGLQPFQRDHLFLDVYNSLSHRKTALTDAGKLTDTIIAAVLLLQTNGVLEKRIIIATTYDVLQRFDAAAAVHYRAHNT